MRPHLSPTTARAIIALVFALTATACTSRGAGSDVAIGVIAPQSGEFAALGRSVVDGIRLAVDAVNAGGGVSLNGRPARFVLHTEDDRGETGAGEMAARRLVEARVVGIIGPIQTDVALAAAAVAQAGGVPLIVPTVTDARLVAVGPLVFRACFDDHLAGRVMAAYAYREVGARRAAVLFDRSARYNTATAASFHEAFTELGGTVVATETFADERGTADFGAALRRIRAARPDVFFSPNYYRATAKIAVQARTLGLTVPILSGEGVNSPDFPLIGGDAVQGVTLPAHFAGDDPRPAVSTFRSRFAQAYGREPDAFAALAYDAAGLLLDALRRAGRTDAEAVRAALAQTEGFAAVTGTMAFGGAQSPQKEVAIISVAADRFAFRTTVRP